MNKVLQILVCPRAECPDYFGSPGCEKLAAQPSGPDLESRAAHKEGTGSPYRFSRAECPTCRAAGRGRVVRQLVSVQVANPVEDAKPAKLPATVGALVDPSLPF